MRDEASDRSIKDGDLQKHEGSQLPILKLKQRPAMDQEEFDKQFKYNQPKSSSNAVGNIFRIFARRFYTPFTSFNRFFSTILAILPILQWLPKYSRSNLLYDIIGGLTIGIMHVPQGIAYASLAGQEPVIGLYTSLFPVITYMIFGTSRHCSIGSFAVVALMAGNAVSKYSNVNLDVFGSNHTYTPIEVASTLTVEIGIIQVIVGFLGLDFVCTYLSDDLVAGFTTGASMHVFVTQLKDIFGIYGLPRREGPGNLLFKVFDLAANWAQANVFTTILSASVIAFLIFGRYFNPFFQKKARSPIPIPFDLLAVIITTIISIMMNLKNEYKIVTVGHIPTGLPSPHLPAYQLFLTLLPDALSITTVIMAIHISLAKMFSQKYQYPIDTNQEFYALGFTSIISGCFPTFPSSCSLARTMVNGNVGTRTQLSSVFCTTLIVSIVVYFGTWLNPLPMCVLGSIIVVALLGMLEKFKKLGKLWRISKIDFLIWMVAFVATVVMDVIVGLAMAISFALFTAVMRQQWPQWHVLANVVGTTEYRDVERYKNIYFFNGVCVFRFDCPLVFLNTDSFRQAIIDISWKSALAEANKNEIFLISNEKQQTKTGRHIVVDCSGFVYVDRMGVDTLKEIHVEMKGRDVVIFFAGAKACLREMFAISGHHNTVPRKFFFPTVHDAVARAQIEQQYGSSHTNDVDMWDEIPNLSV